MCLVDDDDDDDEEEGEEEGEEEKDDDEDENDDDGDDNEDEEDEEEDSEYMVHVKSNCLSVKSTLSCFFFISSGTPSGEFYSLSQKRLWDFR